MTLSLVAYLYDRTLNPHAIDTVLQKVTNTDIDIVVQQADKEGPSR